MLECYSYFKLKKISGFSSEEYISLPAKDRMTPESFEKIATILTDELSHTICMDCKDVFYGE